MLFTQNLYIYCVFIMIFLSNDLFMVLLHFIVDMYLSCPIPLYFNYLLIIINFFDLTIYIFWCKFGFREIVLIQPEL